MNQPYIDITLPSGFSHSYTKVNDITLHALEGGIGKPLVLLGGWPQTSYVWRLLLEPLSKHFHVIALDLRGQGDSDIPENGYDCGTSAQEVINFMAEKQISSFYLVGHDVGAWVAFTLLKLFPQQIEGLGLIDAAIPGLVSKDFFSVENAGKIWQFYFHKVPDLADSLVKGKEKEYLTWYFTNKSKRQENLSPDIIDHYVHYYSRPHAMKAGFLWYSSLEESIKTNTLTADTRFVQPIFTMGGEFATKSLIYNGLAPYCDNITNYLIENCGHYIPEEAPEDIMKAILATFKN